jgi:hypothetical protein
LSVDDIAVEILLSVLSVVMKTMESKPSIRYQHKYFYLYDNESDFTISKVLHLLHHRRP